MLNSTFKGASADFVPFICYIFIRAIVITGVPSIDVKEKEEWYNFERESLSLCMSELDFIELPTI